jgi:hypothetical protein
MMSASRVLKHFYGARTQNRLKSTPAYQIFRRWRLFQWQQAGKPLPPPNVFKQETVKAYAKRFSLAVLVETGTFMGDMIYNTRHVFEQIHSVELDNVLYANAVRRFRRYSHIHLWHGDSNDVLPQILKQLNWPALFWLDAHYSAGITARGLLDTPIVQEIRHIAQHTNRSHVLLIDDAREFGTAKDYPTLDELNSLITGLNPRWRMLVEDDIIRIST